jgi:hypothetical protein
MRVKVTARHGDNQHSGLEVDRNYAVHAGPDPEGRVLVFDDHTTSFRTVTPAEYREVPDPLEPHDLLRIDQDEGGYRAVCTCVWQPWTSAADPDAAVQRHRGHLWHMDIQERLLTMPVHPLLVAWINDLQERQRRRQEPER